MHEDEPTYFDPLDDIEDLLAIRAYSPTFWDAAAGELVGTDPWEHPSWDVADDALADGWDDPADAVEVLEQTLIGDHRLTPLADTAYGPPPLVLVPVDGSGLWPAADYGERGIAA